MKIKDCMTLTNVTQEKLSIRILSEYPNEERMSFEEMKHHKWEHSLLSPSSVDFLKSLPYRIDTVCEGQSLSVLHYCMDRDGHYIHYKPNPSEKI